MSKAFKCDICNNLFDGESRGTEVLHRGDAVCSQITIFTSSKSKTIDICLCCVIKLVEEHIKKLKEEIKIETI